MSFSKTFTNSVFTEQAGHIMRDWLPKSFKSHVDRYPFILLIVKPTCRKTALVRPRLLRRIGRIGKSKSAPERNMIMTSSYASVCGSGWSFILTIDFYSYHFIPFFVCYYRRLSSNVYVYVYVYKCVRACVRTCLDTLFLRYNRWLLLTIRSHKIRHSASSLLSLTCLSFDGARGKNKPILRCLRLK